MGGDGRGRVVEKAVENVLSKGLRTKDLIQVSGVKPVSTSEMGGAIVDSLEEFHKS